MTLTATNPPAHRTWRTAMPVLLVLLATLLWVYRDTAAMMVGIWWRSGTFTHAFLVPPISLWLIWRQRKLLSILEPRPQPWILVPLLGCAALWLAADLVVINAVTQIALVAMLVLSVPLVLGLEVARAILFPLMFLFFSVPIGEFLLPTLMEGTADFTVAALRLTGIPVYREGQHFTIPSGSWSVVEACSGVRYLIASFMVGTLFAYLNYRSIFRRVVFMCVALVVPVVANWLRAYMIVMLGHLSSNTIAVGVDHLIYGWIFFGIVIMIMFMLGARWMEQPAPRAAIANARSNSSMGQSIVQIVPVAAVAALIFAVPHAALQAIEAVEATGTPVLTLPNAMTAPWQAQDDAAVDWRPAFEGATTQAQRIYAGLGQSVGLYIAYYRQQSDGRKLVSSSNKLVLSGDPQWNQVASGRATLNMPTESLDVRSGMILEAERPASSGRRRLLAWKLYWVNGTWTSNDYMAKLAGAWHRLRGRGDDSAAVVAYTVEGGPGSAERALATFMQANLRSIESSLTAARAAAYR